MALTAAGGGGVVEGDVPAVIRELCVVGIPPCTTVEVERMSAITNAMVEAAGRDPALQAQERDAADLLANVPEVAALKKDYDANVHPSTHPFWGTWWKRVTDATEAARAARPQWSAHRVTMAMTWVARR